MIYGYINKIIPFSSVDGPGNRTTIFLQGCNFNCAYCHNPETINNCINCGDCIKVCKSGALDKGSKSINWNRKKCSGCDECINICKYTSTPKVMKMTVSEIIDEINQYKNFIQGITVSGGECTLQKEFLVELFKEVKKLGLTTFIDSNGSLDFRTENGLLDICDGVMLDVKSFDNFKHKEYIKFDNKDVISNLIFLKDRGKLYEVRTVIVPEMFNNEETVLEVSKIIGTSNMNIRYKLIKFRPIGVRTGMKNRISPSDTFMDKLKEIADANNVKDIIII